MRVKAVSGITLTLLLMNMLTLVFNAQPVDANPVYPGQVTMTREDIDATISLVDSVVQASVNGTYTFHVFGGTPPNPITMYYPVPPNASNVSVKIDETPLAWDWNGTYYHTVLGDYPFIKWTIFTYPAYFTIRTHYEHPIPLVEREYQFLYAMGTGRYLAEPKECEAYVRTYVSKDVAPTQSLMEVYLVTEEGIPEPATHEITSLDGVWNVSYHVTFWWGWSKDFLMTIRANPWTVDDDGGADFTRIQDAINAASPGDTIYVYNGTYYEQVVVNKSVSLLGEDEIAKPTIINNVFEAEFAVCISANNVTISGFEVRNSGGFWGIILNHSSNSIVSGNIVKAVYAILVDGGSGNNISDNRVNGFPMCVFEGLTLIGSSNNVVTGNYFGYDCHYAFSMYGSNHNYIAFNYISGHFTTSFIIINSNNNSIVGNTIWPSSLALGHISFMGSNGNVLYHNSFLADWGPIIISIDEVSMNNTWDNGYPSGGNYWSNYTGVDLYNGPYQNQTGNDGIDDTPYIIDEYNIDRYPLMVPFGPLTLIGENVPVFPTDDISMIFENVTAEGFTTVDKTEVGPEPPSGFKLAEQYYNIETTANYSGKIRIRIIYDGDMTQEEEESLQLLQWNETTQQWEDITTHVDTIINAIYGETSHLSIFATITEPIHDVAILDITPAKTTIDREYNLSISVSVENLGDYLEIFNVTIYYNETNFIATQNITLASGNSTTIAFTWNTTGISYGNYTLTATTTPVPNETNTADNTLTDGWVVVTILGDADGSGRVVSNDFFLLVDAFGSRPGDSNWNPNCDFDDSGRVVADDFFILVDNFGDRAW